MGGEYLVHCTNRILLKMIGTVYQEVLEDYYVNCYNIINVKLGGGTIRYDA